jgi:hypothetical protein
MTLEKGISLSIWAPFENLDGGSLFTRDFLRHGRRRALETSLSLSLWELCERNLEGRLLYW